MSNKKEKTETNQISQEKPCNHFMVWNTQGGYSYYRCDKCNFINGKKTFEDYIPIKGTFQQGDWEKDLEKMFIEDADIYGITAMIKKLLLKEREAGYNEGYNKALEKVGTTTQAYQDGYNDCLKDFKIKNEMGEKSL